MNIAENKINNLKNLIIEIDKIWLDFISHERKELESTDKDRINTVATPEVILSLMEFTSILKHLDKEAQVCLITLGNECCRQYGQKTIDNIAKQFLSSKNPHKENCDCEDCKKVADDIIKQTIDICKKFDK